jgi:hypothetical protein
MNSYDQDICHVTLEGPAHFGPSSPLIALLPWTQPEWRRIVVEFHVGTDQCPDWNYANLCLTAIEELIMMADGLLSDDVLQAISANVPIVSLESFRGPPRH